MAKLIRTSKLLKPRKGLFRAKKHKIPFLGITFKSIDNVSGEIREVLMVTMSGKLFKMKCC